MTRFEMNMAGMFGDYWKKDAEKKLDELRKELADGEVTIDENGVAHNCIGRVVTSEVLVMLTYVTDEVDVEATNKARDEEEEAFIAEYRKNARPMDAEMLWEMRAAFGPGATVVDVFTGRTYHV